MIITSQQHAIIPVKLFLILLKKIQLNGTLYTPALTY